MSAPSAPIGSAIVTFFELLREHGYGYGGADGDGGNFQCPCHDDREPSLHVEVGETQAVVAICRACGVSLPAVLDALSTRTVPVVGGKKSLVPASLGLTGSRVESDAVDWGSEHAAHTRSSGRNHKLGRYVDTWLWDYLTPDREPVRRVVRTNYTNGKQISQLGATRSRTGFLVWRADVQGVPVTPLNWELFNGWISADATRPLYITEGEKAADALTDAGHRATTYPGGAGGKLPSAADMAEHFNGFTRVRVWADADDPGVRRGFRLAERLREALPDAEIAVVMNAGPVKKGDDAADVDLTGTDIEECHTRIAAVEEGFAALDALCDPKAEGPDRPEAANALWYSESRLAVSVPEELRARGIHLRWTPEGSRYGTWRKFTLLRWVTMGEEEVREILREHFNDKWEHAAPRLISMDAKSAQTVRAIHKALLSKRNIREVADLMRGVAGVHTDPGAFDNDPSVLNTPSGLIDLTADPGEAGVRALAPADLISKTTRAKYVHRAHYDGGDEKHAKARRMVARVNAAVQEDQLEYVLDRLGTDLFGAPTHDDKIPTGFGGGHNGKTTFTALYLDNALGFGDDHYAASLSKDLLEGARGTHPEMLLQLKGFRIGLLNEPRVVAESRVKEVTDKIIDARQMFGLRTSFLNTCAIWITSNHASPTGYDGGSLRRFEAISFPYYFGDDPLQTAKYGPGFVRRGHERIRALAEQNDRMGEVALADLVDRARRWHRGGRKRLEPPESVRVFTREQVSSGDLLYEFFQAGPFEPGGAGDVVPVDNLSFALSESGVWQEFMEFAGEDHRSVARSHLSFRKAINKHHGLPFPLVAEKATSGRYRNKMVFVRLRRKQDVATYP